MQNNPQKHKAEAEQPVTKGKVSQEADKRIQDLEFLSRTAMGFLDLPPQDDVYEFIAQQLKALAGKSIVIVASFDEATGSACVRAILGLGRNTAAVMRMLGKHPLGMALAIDEEARLGLGTGKLVKVPGGLFEYCFKRIPKTVCHAIEKLLNLGDIYAMGFTWKGKLFGSAAILTHRGSILQDQALIEAFIKQASVALQRWHAEEALKKAHDELEVRVDKRTRELVKVNKQLLADITERKRAEEALRESEKRYRDLADLLPQTVFELDERSNLIFVNRNAFDMFCYSQEDFDKGLSAIQMFIPEDRDRAKENIKRRLRGEKFGISEYTALRKDGSTFPVLLHSAPIIHEGKPIGLRGIIIDITERKRAEEALRESEEKFRSLAEQSPNMIFINKKGKVVYANKRCEEVTGYKRNELRSPDFDFLTLIAPEFRDLVKANFDRHMRSEEVAPLEYSLITRDGKRVEAILATKLIKYEKGSAILGIVTDITMRKRMEEALRESENKYRTIFETTEAATVIVEEDMTISLINKECEKLMGYSKEEVEGKRSWTELVVKDDLERMKEYHRLRRIAPNTAPRNYECRVIDKWGNVKIVLVTVATIPGTKRSLASVLDITERKLVEDELRRLRERSRGLSRHLQRVREEERAEIAREIHDDLGQSLTALKIDLSLLRKRLPKEQESLIQKTTEMITLIDTSISNVKRISSRLRPGLLDDLGLVPAIQWEVKDFEQRTGIKCKLTTNAEDIAIDRDISTAFFRILQEALTNVARHANATKVNIDLRRKANNLKLKITDNGKGITKKQIQDSKSFGLMGIRERIEYLGGEFKITGVRGNGTTLVSIVPLKQKGKAQ